MKTITHLTSVHARYDTRIFSKMCKSAARNGFDVNLVVADGMGNEEIDGVKIVDSGPKSTSRMLRWLTTTIRVFRAGRAISSAIYHIHDPELIPAGLVLKSLGGVVIFDSHEDFPKQLLSKPYLGQWLSFFLSHTFGLFERVACKNFDGVIAATPFILKKFLDINSNSIDVNNYPELEELDNTVGWDRRKREISYVGNISKIRGIRELIQSLESTQGVELNLAGKFADPLLENEVRQFKGWNKVKELGHISRKEVAEILQVSQAGIVTFHSQPNHVDAQPNKMFEYMSASLPVIASNFPLWKDIVEGNNCGICVDPKAPDEIAAAVQYIFDNPDKAEEMGRNGRAAIVEKYNWANEETKMLSLYGNLVL